MYTKVNEQIEVFANFNKRGAEPICFSWKNNDYNITSVNFRHHSKVGDKKIFYFAVTANQETYKLIFDPIDLTWILEEVYLDNDFSSVNTLNDRHR